MNIFQFIGDMIHLSAIVLLLSKMLHKRTSAGISLKTQFLYAIVFTTRYADLFFSYYSIYNSVMKIFFFATSWHICYLMFYKNPWKTTYDKENDTFRIIFLIIPCLVLAILIRAPHLSFAWGVLWSFSIYLESVLILPQIFLLEYTECYDALTSHYVFALGLYRFFYILNWIYRWYFFSSVNWISVCAGSLQTLLFIDFFYNYFYQIVRKAKFRYTLDSKVKN